MLAILAQFAAPGGVGLPALCPTLPHTARAVWAALAGFLLVLACGSACIDWLQARFREPVKSAAAAIEALHASKHDTPTMGGLLLVGALMLVAVVAVDWTSPYLPLVLLTTVSLCALGVADDLIKLRTARRGLTARSKLAAQAAIALFAAIALYGIQTAAGQPPKLALPLAGSLDMGVWFVPWAALVIVATSNAVNVTDGLDGLAGGCLAWSAAALAVVTAASQLSFSSTMTAQSSPAAEVSLVAAALAGVSLAFLWFNRHPALVFMGDAGSLPLGGLLGLLAVIARQEILLVLIGGVFVVEMLSVIMQIAWFRWTGRRIFRCAPLHHHFQLLGWSERQIVRRFWIAGALCAGAAVALLIPMAEKVSPPAQPVAREQHSPVFTGQEPVTFAELF